MQRSQIAPSLLLALGLAAIAPGCGAPAPEESGAALNPDLAEGRHVFSATDGAGVPYVVSGDGEITVVLVHCWMCERSFWDAQIPALRDSYRVIALDLPGHGEGGDTRETWSIAGYGEDVAGLLAHLDLERVVLVGHSMGGPVSLKAAALAGDRVVGIVAVDTLQDADFEFQQPMVAEWVASFEADFRGVCTDFLSRMFVEQDVEEIVDRVRRVGCEDSNAEAGKALMRDFASLDFPALFREAGVPIRAINAAAPNPTQIETNRKYADFDAVLMQGVGHYPHMTRPEQFNALLLETLEQML